MSAPATGPDGTVPPADPAQPAAGRPTFVEQIMGSATPDLMNDLRSVFSLALSQSGVTFLEGLYEDGAAPVDEAARAVDGELDGLAVDHAAPSVAEPHQLVAVHAFALAHDGADDRVQSRTVAAAGEHPNAHGHQCVAWSVGCTHMKA